MNKLSKHLKKLIVCLLVLSMGSMIVSDKSDVYAFNSSINNVKEKIIRDVGINSENNNSINKVPSNVIIDKLQRKTVSRYANTVTGPDAFLNKKINNIITKQVASTPIPTCVSGVSTTANVSNSTQFKNALESANISCIVLTSDINISLVTSSETYATITSNKTIVSDSNVRTVTVTTPSSIVGTTTGLRTLFRGANNFSITLYNLNLNYTPHLSSLISNLNIFYGFDTINILKTQIIHDGLGLSISNNLAHLIGHSSALSNSINIENSVITATTGSNQIITSKKININNSNVTLHVEKTDGIYAVDELVITNSSQINVTGYNNSNSLTSNSIEISKNSSVSLLMASQLNSFITGINAGSSLLVDESTISANESYDLTNITQRVTRGIVINNASSVVNINKSTVNSDTLGNTIEVIGSNSKVNVNESIINSTTPLNTIKSQGNTNVFTVQNNSLINHTGNSTAIHIGELSEKSVLNLIKSRLVNKLNSSAFIGETLNLNESTIGLEENVRYSKAPYFYIRSNNLWLNNLSAINFNSSSNLFLTGLGDLGTNLAINNSKLNLDVDVTFLYVPLPNPVNTTYVANVNNMSVDNGEINLFHSGSRYVLNSIRTNTLGFASINGKVSIKGASNKLVIKNVKSVGSTKNFVNYSEGFGKEFEHSFIKLNSDSQFIIDNAKLTYDGNVSLFSTDKNVSFELVNSELEAIMAEQTGNNFTAAHSFISLMNRNSGSIAISLVNSKMDITHKSNFSPQDVGGGEVKPTISIFDDVLIEASESSKITLNANSSNIFIHDISKASFTSGDATDAMILGDKLDHNSIPVEISSIILDNNSSFDYQNNHEFYPVLRTTNFESNNSSVAFKIAGYFHRNTGSSNSIQATNYYHLLYDGISGTVFDFNLDRESLNYGGGTLKFLSATDRNILNSRILTNESVNIVATIDYLNTVTYGGSDIGREFVPFLDMNPSTVMQTVTIKGNRPINSSSYVAQSDTNHTLATVNMYEADIPLPATIVNSNSTNIFFSNLNRRKEVIFGDYVVNFDQSLLHDTSNDKFYLGGYATPDTSIKLGSTSAIFEGGTLENGQIRFKLEIPNEQIFSTLTITTQYIAKDGAGLASSTGNANPKLHLTRHYQYQALEPKLDLNLVADFDNLVFNEQSLNLIPQIIERQSNNIFKINVTDTRYNSPGWELRLCVLDDLKTDFNGVDIPLYNPMIYKNIDNSYTDLSTNCDNALLIAENSSLNEQQTLIQWNPNQGIQLNIKDPSLILKGKNYTGSLRFILTSK